MERNKINNLIVNTSEDESNERQNLINSNSDEITYQNQQPTKSKQFSTGDKPCPTCKGTGRVYREDQNKLVALIPLSDKRLKPKRIWAWSLGTFLICLICISVITFLLAPRSVILTNEDTNLLPYNISYITDRNSTVTGMVLYFDEIFQIKNENFYSVRMKNLTLQLNRNSHISFPKLNYRKNIEIGPRENLSIEVKIKYILYTLNDPYVGLCINGVIKDLFALISTSFSFTTFWNSNLLVDVSKIQYIFCSNQTLSQF